MLFLFFILGMGTGGCEDKNSQQDYYQNDTEVVEVKNSKGTVVFDQNVQKWCIAVHKEGTYDEVQLFLPEKLEESYKVSNKEVLFSGTASNLLFDHVAPAGTYFYSIKISSISSLN